MLPEVLAPLHLTPLFRQIRVDRLPESVYTSVYAS
jgi:hypothetical protein